MPISRQIEIIVDSRMFIVTISTGVIFSKMRLGSIAAAMLRVPRPAVQHREPWSVYRARRPGPLVRLEKIDVHPQRLEHPGVPYPNEAVVIGGNQPAGLVLPAAQERGGHDQPPLSGGMIGVLDFDDRVQDQMRGEHDFAGYAP